MNLLRDLLSKEHPLGDGNTMKLVVQKVSGESYLCQEFQRQLPNVSQELEESLLQQVTNWPWGNGLVGVLDRKLIHFTTI